MDAHAQREFVKDNMDADLQFILGESGVNLQHQVAIARHYGSLRKFSALGDDRPAIRTACLQDFAIVADSPENRSQIAAVVSAWETAEEYLAKEIELKAEAKVLGQPRVLQIHERQAMLRAVEAIHGVLGESECLASDYLSIKAEETESNEPTAAPLDEILSKLASSHSQIQSTVDTTGHIRVTRTKTKSKMPATTEEFRKVVKVEMYAWLCLASRDADLKEAYFTTPVALKAAASEVSAMEVVVEYISAASPGKAAPSNASVQEPSPKVPVVKVLYLFAGRRRHSDVASFLKEAEAAGRIKLVLKEFDIERSPDHDLTDVSLWQQILDTLAEGDWFLIVSPPCNTFSRARFQYKQHPGPKPLRTKAWPKGFPWLSNANKLKVQEANSFVERCIEACICAANSDGFFILEHPEDLGVIEGEHPGSIWQWPEVLDLIPQFSAVCFAIHQCHFGALTPKPTRLLTNMQVEDGRCHFSMPKFDKLGFYKGPLPRKCGHQHTHSLIGKTGHRWNTSPAAAYPPAMCKFIAQLILSSIGGGPDQLSKKGVKRPIVEDSGNTSSKAFKTSPVVEDSVDTSNKLGKTSQAVQPSSLLEVVISSGEETDPESSAKGQQLKQGSTGESIQEDVGFDMTACYNSGAPIKVEWDQAVHGFIDGFGLCSPTRWRPKQRGERRTVEMKQLADDTFAILEGCVNECIGDVRKEAFRLVTGKLDKSPFTEAVLDEVRGKWAGLLPDPVDARTVDEGQPFFLRALAQWLKRYDDPDAHWLVDEQDSFSTGVYVGVDKELPRTPQVFPVKVKHRKMDETEFAPIADNYPSAQLSSKELEDKFREEEQLGRMHPSKLGVLRQEYGDKLRIASMAAISKPDGTVRPLHDATHSVMVNHEIRYRDKIISPGPAEIAAIVREAAETSEAPFCVSADIRAAHRLVKIRKEDWGYLCCRADSSSDTVWVNHTGTFGVSSAPYWWAKLAGMLGRFVRYVFHTRWMMQMIYVDDLHGVFVGPDKFRFLWIWLLAFELIGTPFGYRKFKGGFAPEFVGFQIRYDLVQVGISKRRGDWLAEWIDKAEQNRYVVAARDFVEFLGRLGFVSQLLIWLKPHLAPLFAWSAVTSKSTVGRLPETVVLTLRYIRMELDLESYLVSTKRPLVFKGESFRTDAKCADGYIILGGWELSSKRWFSIKLFPSDAPYLFKEGGESQWASTAAELLASLCALKAFGWLDGGRHRKSLEVSLFGGTDNRANEALTAKRSTTKWPLMAINMQMSSLLASSRLSLSLRWRPRQENTEADNLTNEIFDGFTSDKRVLLTLSDLDLSVLNALVAARGDFEDAKKKAEESSKLERSSKSKRFDKTPW
eukprot:s2122_g6.t1